MLKSLRVSFALLLCLSAYAAPATGKWDTQSFELARRIVALAGQGPATLNFENISSIQPDSATIIQRNVRSDLKASGIEIRDSAPTSIRVILSENIRGFLWIAEVRQSGKMNTTMFAFTNAEVSAGSDLPLAVRRFFLFSQQEPILDATLWQSHDERYLVVLGPSHVKLFRQNAAQWTPTASLVIPHDVYPRDLRGRLRVGPDGEWVAFLPSIQCSGTVQLQGQMSCRQSDDPWQLSAKLSAFYNSARNYFTGALVPAASKPLPPFYSAVSLASGEITSYLFTSLNRELLLSDGTTTSSLNRAHDLGSDIALVHSGCGSGTQLLATADADDYGTDSLQAFEVDEREVRSVSPPLGFAGVLTALWTNEQGDAAVAVLRTETGSYEAYSVSVACNQ